MHSLITLINHYGYIILFCALVLELIAFPLPGEFMMTYCGFLVFEMKLNWIISILVASTGAILGITISYFIGKGLGYKFFHKYGHYIHLGPDKLEKTTEWFKQYGNKLLILAYFIPGVRHITGYFSGITKISYRKFALNAYLGAFIWSATFISLGKVLGPDWEKFHSYISKYLLIGSLIITLILLIIYLSRNHKVKIVEFTYNSLDRTLKIFHSLGKIKIATACIAVAFLGLSALFISITQDFFAHELDQFDTIVTYLVNTIFTKNWRYMMDLLGNITSLKILIPLTVCMILLIIIKGIDRFLEIRFLFLSIWGGEILQTLLRLIFRRLGPSELSLASDIKYTFPSKEALLSVVVYGFICFIILRHAKQSWIGTVSVVITIIICFLGGLSPLFYQIQYPSDVYAGYVFGGVWLTLNIVLLEIYRILPKIN